MRVGGLFVRAYLFMNLTLALSALGLWKTVFACFEFSDIEWFVTTRFYGWLSLPFLHDWVGFICPLSVADKRLPVSVVVM